MASDTAMIVEKHHSQFPKSVHNSQKDTKEIRRNPWLIPPLDSIGHAALHRSVILVPAPDRFTAHKVNKEFIPVEGDYIASLRGLMRVYDRASRERKITALQRDLNQLIVHSLELQIPFIKDSLVLPDDLSSMA